MKHAALLLAFATCCVSAQHVAVPPEVATVSTLGRWSTGSVAGSYRVLVVRDGWEHVWSRVYVEWLPDPTDRDAKPPDPVSVQELIPPGIAQGSAVLEATARTRGPGVLEVSVSATSNMQLGAKAKRFVFVAREPGVVRLASPAKAQ
jgi:hypothetical protein